MSLYLSGIGFGLISPSLSPHKSFSVSLSQILTLLIQLYQVCSLTHNPMSTLKISPLLPCQVPSDLYLGWMSFDRAHIYTVKGIVHQIWKLIIMSSQTLFYLSSIENKWRCNAECSRCSVKYCQDPKRHSVTLYFKGPMLYTFLEFYFRFCCP